MPTSTDPAPPPPDAVVDVRGLTRRFDDLVAVDALDLAIAKGETFGLLGSNGAGKTATIRMLTTILPPTAGTASIDGLDVVRDARRVRQRIGSVPQMVSADPALTGRENLLLFARLYGMRKAHRRRRIDEALARMGLEEASHRLVRTYSGGMIRRLEIAQSMLHRPAVLFLDEPTVGLDPAARRTVWDLIRVLREENGTTVLLTTHDMDEAEALCARIAIMHRGRVAASGAPAELRASLGPAATLDDVFIHHTGGALEPGGTYRDAARERRTAQRLG